MRMLKMMQISSNANADIRSTSVRAGQDVDFLISTDVDADIQSTSNTH